MLIFPSLHQEGDFWMAGNYTCKNHNKPRFYCIPDDYDTTKVPVFGMKHDPLNISLRINLIVSKQ